MTAEVAEILGAAGHPSNQDASLDIWDSNDVKWSIRATSDLGAPSVAILKDGVRVFNFGGTSAVPIVDDTASVKFLTNYFDNGATSGQATGMYTRIYATGAGGGAIAARNFATISDVAAANVYGTHSSVSFGATGTVTGLAAGVYANILLPNTTPLAGTLTAINAEIWSDGATSDPAGSQLSVFRVSNGGNATGAADVDTDAYLFDFQGWTPNAGSMIGALAGNEPTWTSKTALIKCRQGSTVLYLVAVEV